MPSATPEGIFTVTVRRERTRPSPPHCTQGSGMVSPVPRQVGHTRAVTTWPRKLRWTDWTSPAPPQVSQVTACVPGAVPAPVQTVHSTAVSTLISRFTPLAHSARVSFARSSASEPGCTRLRGPRPPPPPWPPKNASMMSPRPKPWAPPPKPLAVPPPDSMGSPPRSTTWRLAGSERTS